MVRRGHGPIIRDLCAAATDARLIIKSIVAESSLGRTTKQKQTGTFRLDPDEYDALRRVCISTGARSMSEFAREAVLGHVNAGGTSKTTLEGDLVTLTGRLTSWTGY